MQGLHMSALPSHTVSAPTQELHPELALVHKRFEDARASPPETHVHWPGVLQRPSFFSIETLQRHLSNPLLHPDWLSLVFRGQAIPLEQAYCYKVVQTKRLYFIDKRFIEDYLRRGASVILEGLDLLEPGINAFAAHLDAGFPCALVNAVAFFSQRGNELYRGHIDSDDVLVIHLSGEKRWRLFAKQAPRRVNTSDLTPEQMGAQLTEVLMRPGDVLYVRSGVPHICDTVSSHSLHMSFDLADRTPTVEHQVQAVLARYAHATRAPYTPATDVARTLAELLQSASFQEELVQRTETMRAEVRAFRSRIGAAGQGSYLSRFAGD
jgi:hypothetical protein